MAIGKVGKLLAAGAALFFLLVTAGIPSGAREVKDSVKIHFSQGYSVLDPSLGGNREALARIADSLRLGYADSVYTLKKVLVVGGASPEGGIEANRRLSEKRARVLFDWLSQYGELPDSLTSFEYLGRDWSGLIELVEQDAKVPYREETLDFLREVERLSVGGEKAVDNNVGRLSRFKGGEPYRYMYRELFPQIRASQVYLWYEKDRNPVYLPGVEAPVASLAMPPRAAIARAPQEPELSGKPFYMALKTNLLYDVLLVPNVAAEFYLGSSWSLTGGWMYGWWKSDPAHWYWRTYGGELGVRRWFGRKAQEKPLTGHHLGVYGQLFTYDFELGGKGYMGGTPGQSMWDSPNWALGVEYGYSLPIARRLNLDFTVGVGYWGGIYYEYTPQDGHYVWEATRNRRWFGPTKAEISLVWLLGRGNTNGNRGGSEMRKTSRIFIPVFAGISLTLTSCLHKELCFDHEPHVVRTEVMIEAEYEKEWQYTYEGIDWADYATWNQSFGMTYDSLRPDEPDGLRVQIYNEDGSNNILNIEPEGESVRMFPGEHSILFYNNDTEYIVFDDMQSYASARATTRTRTRSSYMGNPFAEAYDENTVNSPDMLYGNYVDSYVAEPGTEADVMHVTMHPLVFTYLVRYEFSHGQEYVALARGALSGMAEAVWLHSGQTSDESATILYDCTVEDFGAQALVRSFGIPGFPNGHYSKTPDSYSLNLEVRLRNGTIKSFDFDVTDQVESQPQGGVIIVDGIEISDEEGMAGGSGFDVEVDDWGDYEDIELPL